MRTVKDLCDLLRAHFIPAWVLIFTAGYMTAVHRLGGFEWETLVIVVLVAVCGFEVGMVVNDYVDKELDRLDVANGLTKYFRPFGTRPLITQRLPMWVVTAIIVALMLAATVLILRLAEPHRYYVWGLMIYAYVVEIFYQLKKRGQTFPWAQLIGRTDFSLFPVAGYLVLGLPGLETLLYFLYFYPLAEAHLGVNDLADFANDKARGLATIPVLYGKRGTVNWVILFTLAHLVTASVLVVLLNPKAWVGFGLSFVLLLAAVVKLRQQQTERTALKVLPMFHASMAIQSLALIFLG